MTPTGATGAAAGGGGAIPVGSGGIPRLATGAPLAPTSDIAFSTATTPNDGKEIIAFMPQLVADSIHPPTPTLDFSSPQYAHNAYVDATPGTGDLFYNGAWHTWLVSGLGAGGNPAGVINDSTSTATGALFALDITNPASFNESSASALVIKEWNSTNLVCVNDAVCKASLGSVYGTPIIRLMHDGNWAVIFGNGRNSATGTAGIFIISVNRTNGAQHRAGRQGPVVPVE